MGGRRKTRRIVPVPEIEFFDGLGVGRRVDAGAAMSKQQRELRSWSVSTTDLPEHSTVVVARSAGAAKYRYWLDVSDACPDFPFTKMRARVIAGYAEPRGFRDCMEYRRVPFARVGMRVRFDDGKEGTIVGHNSSANLDVIVDGGDEVFNCHPAWKISFLVDGQWRRSPQAPERETA